jgi:peptide-methionine (S)-S-oxide reductase
VGINNWQSEMRGNTIKKIGLGGSCHWCTEAIFQSLKGVEKVDQGWISSFEAQTLSEAVIVHFHHDVIALKILIEIHLRTHSSASDHSMREKYRSAIYAFNEDQFEHSSEIILEFEKQSPLPLITEVHHFDHFKLNTENYLDYYRKSPEKPFCRNVIDPKLRELRREYGAYVVHNYKQSHNS